MKKLYRNSAFLLAILLLMLIVLAGCQKNANKKTTSLEDGTYTLDDFTWSGGSGRVEITCDTVTVKKGVSYVTLYFSSPYYTKVSVDDKEYEGEVKEDRTSFAIPVTLNQENTIKATTTKMSTAHEITYKINPYLKAAGGEDDKETQGTGSASSEDAAEDAKTAETVNISHEPPNLPGLTYESTLELTYAKGFDVFSYSDGYQVINVYDSAQYLVVPEGKTAPEGLDDQMVILQKPLDHIYLAATSAMALFRAMDDLDQIRLTGTQADGWYVTEAARAMKEGTMLFAGKYSEPDYELLVSEDCKLAIESTMILHTPKVKEMIEQLGIPVFVDRSSYESHPLGRTEWVKLYAVLAGKEEVARTFFDEQAQIVDQLKDFPNTEKTVAFFYVDTNGTVVVRSSTDYIPNMIEIAGGRYLFKDLTSKAGNSASVSLSMEEFYAEAMDADYLIYNGTIDNPLSSVDELLDKSELFEDFKAVKEGNVWTIGKDLYQSTDTVGEMIGDIHHMLTDGKEGKMVFLEKVD